MAARPALQRVLRLGQKPPACWLVESHTCRSSTILLKAAVAAVLAVEIKPLLRIEIRAECCETLAASSCYTVAQ